jgi:group II intron reverse transcriptase/maturase
MRPLGVPSFDDKLVQEVIRMILETIYEGQFENTSHGFRPKRSCHTALTQIQRTFSGVKWFVEGDIKGFFDNINHEILIHTLKERISDDRFIRLIRKFLKAGYLENWKFHNSYSGTPQGGIASPILANIYLDRLDKFMKEYIEKFDRGKERKRCKQSIKLANKRSRIRQKLKVVKDKTELIKQLKASQKESLRFPYGDEMDADYRRLKYVRYADDFLIGIIGSKQDAIKVKEDIKKFLNDKLALELSDEKTLITHTEKAAKFLGYEISICKSNAAKRTEKGVTRTCNKRVRLMVGKNLVKNKLLHYKVLEIKIHNGKEQWKPKSRPNLVSKDDLEILNVYNSEIRGLANYYSLAINCGRLAQFGYIMEYSMYKSFAHKYRTKVAKILKKYKRNGHFSVRYRLKSGVTKDQTFYHDGFARKKEPLRYMKMDNVPNTYHSTATGLINRLKAGKCELCRTTDRLAMHHVRKLKDLKGETPLEKRMIARKRKTIALCGNCLNNLNKVE